MNSDDAHEARDQSLWVLVLLLKCFHNPTQCADDVLIKQVSCEYYTI